MLPVTNHTLEKLEMLLKTAGYKVRYEKGNFKTGACLLQNSKMIVVNRFSNLESKIGGLAELLQTLEIDNDLLDDKQTTFYCSLNKPNYNCDYHLFRHRDIAGRTCYCMRL